MLRSRKARTTYDIYRKSHATKACDFCDPDPKQIIETHKFVYVLKNNFPYDLWDYKQVSDHLMIIPKRHVESISKLNAEELGEYINVLAAWEAKGYNFYGRTEKSAIKTVPHQHAHLIKTDGSRRKWVLYLQKPYVLWHR